MGAAFGWGLLAASSLVIGAIAARVLRIEHAFQDQFAWPAATHPLDIFPSHSGIELRADPL